MFVEHDETSKILRPIAWMKKDEKSGTIAPITCCQGTLRYDLKILG